MRAAGFDGGALKVGDMVEWRADSGSIFVPGSSRWYALRVGPQQEDQAEAWLKLRGVYGFHPVLMRQITRHGHTREYARRYLPGYVFARFPGEPQVHAVMGCPFICGALTRQGSEGEWGILEPRGLHRIYRMRRVLGRAEASREADMVQRRMAPKLRVGDTALFRVGAFQGFPCEVVELMAEGGVKVMVKVFGREVLADVGGDVLDPTEAVPDEPY